VAISDDGVVIAKYELYTSSLDADGGSHFQRFAYDPAVGPGAYAVSALSGAFVPYVNTAGFQRAFPVLHLALAFIRLRRAGYVNTL
jgi:hypothetical protein